jgi:hypothetical protein
MHWKERRVSVKGRSFLVAHYVKGPTGTALIWVKNTGEVVLDIWGIDQEALGQASCESIDEAKEKAERVLEPRTTCWELLLQEEEGLTG